jgi:hypothetical protein
MPGILAAGEPGMGKSTFIWNGLRESMPYVDADVVENHVFDYKTGLELAACVKIQTDHGRPLVPARNFHYGKEVGTDTPIQGMLPSGLMGKNAQGAAVWGYEETVIPHLRALLAKLRDRAELLRDEAREHIATPGNQHQNIWFDEAAQFNRDHIPKPIRDEITGLIDSLINLGRACGFTVIACTQYPSLDHIKFRHGMLWGLAFKVKTPQAADMVLGQGAWKLWMRAVLCGPPPLSSRRTPEFDRVEPEYVPYQPELDQPDYDRTAA